MITDYAKDRLRDVIDTGTVSAYYTINGAEHQAEIVKQWVTDDKVHLTFRADRTDDGNTITNIAIKDADGNVTSEITKNIVISSDSYVFDFTIKLKYTQGGAEIER